jgi:hypothetical protein
MQPTLKTSARLTIGVVAATANPRPPCDSMRFLVAALLLCGARNSACSRLSRRPALP